MYCKAETIRGLIEQKDSFIRSQIYTHTHKPFDASPLTSNTSAFFFFSIPFSLACEFRFYLFSALKNFDFIYPFSSSQIQSTEIQF